MLPHNADAHIETFSASDAPDKRLPSPTLTASDIRPTRIESVQPGISFALNGAEGSSAAHIAGLRAQLPLPGVCNVYNALAAVAICRAVGIDPQISAPLLREVSVPGRCEAIRAENGVTVLIDYAHNETSLREILKTLRPYTEKRLIVLFGSVGGRTKNRRRPMGAVASALADLTILTSDNPDREPPLGILEEIRSGMASDALCVLIPDRREAIEYALRTAEPGDLLLLAGKGHETYQLVNGEKLPFSEKEIVTSFLNSRV